MKVSKGNMLLLLMVLGTLMVIFLETVFSKSNLSPVPSGKVSGFSATKAYEHVKYLSDKIGSRPAGSKAELKAAQYIHYVLDQTGWKVREQPFSKVVVREASIGQPEKQVELINSQNVIAELQGSSPDTIIIGAHYDSANLNAPGAVDNASGVGVLLELARILSSESHQETYQLIFFGAEEYGLVGSQFFASQADLSAVRWMLNLDMVGTPLEIDVAGKKSAPPELIKQVTALAGESNIPFHLSRDFILMTRDSSQGGSSDFSSFLDQEIPAVGLGIYGRPAGYYHRPEDRLDRVSLEEMQKIGEYTHQLLISVKLEKLGPRDWDELYIPFQIGKHVMVVPSHGIRIFTLFTLLVTGLILAQAISKNPNKPSLIGKKVITILGITFLTSLIVIGVSGIGEFFWQWIKQVSSIYYSYPVIFVLARLVFAFGTFLLLASWFNRLPLAREPELYWFIGGSLLFVLSLVTALIRIDLAFPFVFWLFCMNLQYFLPNLILVLIGPYFIVWFHYELLNSPQWISYYEAIHNHSLIFLAFYSILLIPFFIATLHVAIQKKQVLQKCLVQLRKPALALSSLIILFLGLVPVYTRAYPQSVVVREEWSGSKEGTIHIFSNDDLPRKVVADFNGKEGKSLFVPVLNEKSPFSIDASVAEKIKNSQRTLEVAFKLNYTSEPYIIRLKLESDQPFEVKTDEFLPMSKLPKKIQLKGFKQSTGTYSIVLQRTPPQKNMIQLSVETQGVVSCTVQAMFPEPSPRILIRDALISVDYQIGYEESFNF